MLKYVVVFATAGMLTMGTGKSNLSSNPAIGSWQIDTGHSDAQLITDATTEFGKRKIDATLGFARVSGDMNVDGDPEKSSIDLEIYPATSMAPVADQEGNFLGHWLGNVANHTLICFHSRNVVRKADGRWQSTGNLVLTRVDRNVVPTSTTLEDYSGPIYGPPMVHRIAREATFVFDVAASATENGGTPASGSTSMYRENFPQLLRTVVATYWPPVVQDENCQYPTANEAFHGPQCSGKFLKAPPLPQDPHAGNLEDFPGVPNYNAVVGNRLAIQLHLRLQPKTQVAPAKAK